MDNPYLQIAQVAASIHNLQDVLAMLEQSETIPEMIGMQVTLAYDAAQGVRRQRGEAPLILPLSPLSFEHPENGGPRFASRDDNAAFLEELAGNIATLKDFVAQLVPA